MREYAPYLIEYAWKQGTEQTLKKDWKKCKKGVDRRLILWYYVRVVSERCSRATQILENDTESRRTRVWFFGVTFKRDSQFEMSFELEGKPRDSIQDLTQEFDPGSGRTLAACLTHASRAGIVRSLLWAILAADGWVTREQPASYWGITHRKMC